MYSYILAYQSLNANSSHEHGINSLNSQPHTVMAHDHYATTKKDAYILHHSAEVGPPEGVKVAPAGTVGKGKYSDREFSLLLGNKVQQMSDNIQRSFGNRPDLLAFGEVNFQHPEMDHFNRKAGVALPTYMVHQKACQNFSVYRGRPVPSTQILACDVGWSAALVGTLTVVFVHVPNAIAKERVATIRFYKSIQSKLNGRVIDIIIGDTNQSTPGYTPSCVTEAIATEGIEYLDAHPEADIEPFDSRFLSTTGTNSKTDKKYDVAVYNKQTVGVLQAGYITQHVLDRERKSSMAVTDHMGVVLKVVSRRSTFVHVPPAIPLAIDRLSPHNRDVGAYNRYHAKK